ncbi:MAG: YfiR family protein [Acidobacteriota bacterium]
MHAIPPFTPKSFEKTRRHVWWSACFSDRHACPARTPGARRQRVLSSDSHDDSQTTAHVVCKPRGRPARAAHGCEPRRASPAVALAQGRLVYNFAKFADWPADVLPNAGPFGICVIDQTGLADALMELVHGQSVGGHPLLVRRVTPGDDLRSCHLLYVSGFDTKRYLQLPGPLKDSAVLTISDCEQFTLLGGVANIFVDDHKLRFAISLESARRSKLILSSRLLSLAKVIHDPSTSVRSALVRRPVAGAQADGAFHPDERRVDDGSLRDPRLA